jgi:D-beta-D-heptose 7-phosphate kinase / D-beta-D-heptose 1-phosphate adenosyltransferase
VNVPDFEALTAWVLGDVMLDVDHQGTIERTSPEAPVPIVRTGAVVERLGGAANVAANLAALGAGVTLFGVVGDDVEGRSLARLAAALGIDARLTVDASRGTTVKTRVYSDDKQVVRLDRESTDTIDGAIDDALVDAIVRCERSPDVVVVSDYAKGAVTARGIKVLTTLRPRPIVVADPKRGDGDLFSGVDYITPNQQELARMTGCGAGSILDETDAAPLLEVVESGILVTQGADGMTLFRHGRRPLRVPSTARRVYDVTGAGDSVIAAFSLCLAAGLDAAAATRFANAAGGVAVGRRGTAVVTRSDLADAASKESGVRSKLVTWEQARWLRETNRLDRRRVVFTNGCFDLLHAGHVHLLMAARAFGDVLIVAVDDDESVRELKGPARPVIPLADRAALLSALEPVDAVVVFPDRRGGLCDLIELLQPDVIVKGGEYRERDIVGADVVRRAGGTVELVPLLPLRSTTEVIGRIARSVDESGRPT